MASPYDALFDTKSTPKSSPYDALFKEDKVTAKARQQVEAPVKTPPMSDFERQTKLMEPKKTTASYTQALAEAKKDPLFQKRVQAQKNIIDQRFINQQRGPDPMYTFDEMTPEQKALLYPKAFLDLVKKVDDEEKLRNAQGIQPSYRPSSPIIPGLPSYSEIMEQKPMEVDMSKAYTTYPK